MQLQPLLEVAAAAAVAAATAAYPSMSGWSSPRGASSYLISIHFECSISIHQSNHWRDGGRSPRWSTTAAERGRSWGWSSLCCSCCSCCSAAVDEGVEIGRDRSKRERNEGELRQKRDDIPLFLCLFSLERRSSVPISLFFSLFLSIGSFPSPIREREMGILRDTDCTVLLPSLILCLSR